MKRNHVSPPSLGIECAWPHPAERSPVLARAAAARPQARVSRWRAAWTALRGRLRAVIATAHATEPRRRARARQLASSSG